MLIGENDVFETSDLAPLPDILLLSLSLSLDCLDGQKGSESMHFPHFFYKSMIWKIPNNTPAIRVVQNDVKFIRKEAFESAADSSVVSTQPATDAIMNSNNPVHYFLHQHLTLGPENYSNDYHYSEFSGLNVRKKKKDEHLNDPPAILVFDWRSDQQLICMLTMPSSAVCQSYQVISSSCR